MKWNRIYAADLESALNKNQLEILKSQSLASAGRSICDEIISLVCAEIRAAVANANRYIDEDHLKIPNELKLAAIRLCVEALQARLSGMELTAQQIKLADIARQTIEKVAMGKFLVSSPDIPVQTAFEKKSVKHFARSEKTASFDALRGI